jgi:hypothetical protein
MDLFTVASVTDSGRMDHGEYRSDFMSNLSMAIRTFNFVVSDMIFMHELRGIFRVQYFEFTMALETLPLRNMTITLNHIDMTLFTDDPPGDILPMVKIPSFDIDVSFGLNVA